MLAEPSPSQKGRLFFPSHHMPVQTRSVQAVPLFDDGQEENKNPAHLPAEQIEKIRENVVKAFRALSLKGYARIDMFVRNDGRIAVLEPNTLPGMTPSMVLFHQTAASGTTQTGLIDRIIEFALEVHTGKRGPLQMGA